MEIPIRFLFSDYFAVCWAYERIGGKSDPRFACGLLALGGVVAAQMIGHGHWIYAAVLICCDLYLLYKLASWVVRCRRQYQEFSQEKISLELAEDRILWKAGTEAAVLSQDPASWHSTKTAYFGILEDGIAIVPKRDLAAAGAEEKFCARIGREALKH